MTSSTRKTKAGKVKIPVSLDQDVYDAIKAMAERDRIPFATAMNSYLAKQLFGPGAAHQQSETGEDAKRKHKAGGGK